MARDKLITVRIEGEKREAFNQLAKSQNTDTASLLYDFINQCLSGTIDIKLVTGKKQWIDKIDNQLDTNRLDKLEATTQRIDNRLDTIAKRLDDWIDAIDDRLTDCDQGLSEKIITLEHRINALCSQLDSQKDRQEIDTDSQEIDDMDQLLRLQRETSIATSPLPPSPPDRPAIASIDGTVETDSSIETGTDAIDTLPGGDIVTTHEPAIETAIETAIGDEPAIEDEDKPWLTLEELLLCDYQDWPTSIEGLRVKAKREAWTKRKRGKAYEYQAKLPHHE